ncbi:MAG: hypothetical protein ACI4TW_02925, partial [Prevotella sp.]
KNITSLAVTPPVCETDVFYYVDKQACTLNVPNESVDLYKATDEWKAFYNIVGIASGIDNAAIDAAPEIFVRDGAIYVDGCQSTAVEVYDANGKCVSRTARSVVSGQPHGLYIVKAGKLQKKIVL